MKRIKILLSIVLIIALSSLVFASGSTPTEPNGFSFAQLFTWISTNWVSIALILSEIAALMSVKWSGIIKSIINIVGTIVTKKKG